MHITKIEIRRLHLRTQSNNGHLCRPLVCRVWTDEGIFGDGECCMMLNCGWESAYGMMKELASFIIGMDPLETEVIWNKLYRGCYFGQNGGPVFFSALSALDIALWDIKGKYFNVPVYTLLGGKQRDTVRCYASMFNMGWGSLQRAAHTPQEFAETALEAVSEGFTALKADYMIRDLDGTVLTDEERTGYAAESLLALAESRIAAVREAVGPGVELMIESHAYLDAAVALQFCRRLDKYKITFYEEPFTPFLPTSTHMAEVSPVPIAGGERLYTRMQHYQFMAANAYEYFQPDVGMCGGITEMKKIIDLADMFELPLLLHNCSSPIALSATLQVEAAMARFGIHEHSEMMSRLSTRELAVNEYIPVNGSIHIPDSPGLGNELSEYALTHCDLSTIS